MTALKSFHILIEYDHMFDDMLVFAASRERARSIVVESGPGRYNYTDVRAVRHPSLDRFADTERLMCCNDELPRGCPRFWSDEE